MSRPLLWLLAAVVVASLSIVFGVVPWWAHRGFGSLPSGQDLAHDLASAGMSEGEAIHDIELVTGEVTELTEALRSSSSNSPLERSGIKPNESGSDSEWDRIPRNGIPLGAYLVTLPRNIRAELFLRNTNLNPRDLRVPRDERSQLNTALLLLSERFEKFTRAQANAALVDAANRSPGDLTELPPKYGRVVPGDKPGEVRLKGTLGRPGVITFVDGKAFSARSPLFDYSLEHRAFLVEEVGSAITQWFEVRGLCTSGEADAVMREVFETAERTFARRDGATTSKR